MWVSIAWALALTAADAAEPFGLRALSAPELEGGSIVRVAPGGALEVREAGSGSLRWRVGLGGRPSAVAVDADRVYVATGRHLRAFAGGTARWALDLGAAAVDLDPDPSGHLRVVLPAGTLWVDPARGTFCTPRAPCPGLAPWSALPSVGALGIPYLDLPGFGIPGLGLLVNPALLAQGDVLGALVPPGAPPARYAPPAPPAVLPRGRRIDAGLPPVRLERGRTGKVRVIEASGLPAAPIVPAPEVSPSPE